MTKFYKGPADGKVMMLRHAPKYLRVVVKEDVFDALDSPEDEPRPDEVCYAYELKAQTGMSHVNTGSRPGGGFFPIADYKYVFDQPFQGAMRDRDAWRRWCQAQG